MNAQRGSRFISLLELMKRFPIKVFLALARLMSKPEHGAEFKAMIEEWFAKVNIHVPINLMWEGTDPENWPMTLESLARICREHELKNSAVFVESRMLPVIAERRDVPMFGELLRRIEDEIQSIELLQIPGDRVLYYEQPLLFGQTVADRFPTAAYDIEEAGNCIATDRTTAAVFHLMRVLEVALRAIATSLNIPDPVKEADRNWGKMLGDKDMPVGIWRELDRRRKEKAPDWEPLRPFYDNIYSDLCAVKTAWRNPVMHVEGTYDWERAIHIFTVVRGFMKNLASKIGQ